MKQKSASPVKKMDLGFFPFGLNGVPLGLEASDLDLGLTI